MTNCVLYILLRVSLQVIDFGSSCFENQRVYTYIQSRFYRAPEVILGAKYGMPIDMWSLGCILAELLTGYALFPGEDENDQLACIIELLGMPPQKLLDQSKRSKNFISAKGYPRYCLAETLEDGRIILGSGSSRQGKERGPPGSKSLKKALKGCDDPLFMNFLCGCLEWDPEMRMTPAAALKHSWFRRRLPRPPQSLQGSTVSASGSTTSSMSPATAAATAAVAAAATMKDSRVNADADAIKSEHDAAAKIDDARSNDSVIDKRLQHCCTIINTSTLQSALHKTRNPHTHITNAMSANLANANVPSLDTTNGSTTTNKLDMGSNGSSLISVAAGLSGSITNNGSNENCSSSSSASITNKLRVLLSSTDVNNATTNLSPSSIKSGTKNVVLSSMQQPLSSPSITSSVTNHITSTQ